MQKLIKNYVSSLIKLNKVNEEDREIVEYGLNSALELSINILTTIILGIIFNLIIETVVFLYMYSSVRKYAGGYHMSNSKSCYVFSTGIIIAVLTAIKLTTPEIMGIISAVFLIIAFPIIFKLSPVEASSRELDEDEIKYFRSKAIKNLFLQTALIIILLLLSKSYYAYIISIGLFICSVMLILQKIKVYLNNHTISL